MSRNTRAAEQIADELESQAESVIQDGARQVLGTLNFVGPVYTGAYQASHQVVPDQDSDSVDTIVSDSQRDEVAGQIQEDLAETGELQASDLLGREKSNIQAITLESGAIIGNPLDYADEIEEQGTEKAPEGNYYGRAADAGAAKIQSEGNG